MNVAIESSLYYLVIHDRGDNAIFVFLGTDPTLDSEGGPTATPVTLELLPPRQRFGGAGGIAMGQPVLGRWPGSTDRYRQFVTVSEMEQAQWVPVMRYRICDSWQDYQTPWSILSGEEPTECGSTSYTSLGQE